MEEEEEEIYERILGAYCDGRISKEVYYELIGEFE